MPEHFMLGRQTEAPGAVSLIISIRLVHLPDVGGIGAIERIHADTRGPTATVTAHHVGRQGIGGIHLEVLLAIGWVVGRGLILRLLPVLLQRLGSGGHRQVHIPIGVETRAPHHRGGFHHLLIIRHVDHAKRRRHEVGALVGSAQRPVAVMIVVHAGTDAPVGSHTPGEVQSCAKIDEPARADQLIVGIVVLIVFAARIGRSDTQRIVGRPMACAKEGAREGAIERRGVAHA